jgi:hypothetical protein
VLDAPLGYGQVLAPSPGVWLGTGPPMVPGLDNVPERHSGLVAMPAPGLAPATGLALVTAEGLSDALGLGGDGTPAGHVCVMLKTGFADGVPVVTALALRSVAPAGATIHALLVPLISSIPPAAGAESAVSTTLSPLTSKPAVNEMN